MEKLTLIVQENQLGYTGIFLKPALTLWADGAKIFQGLLTAFASYGVDLSNIRVDTINQSPAGQVININLGILGRYAFRFNQVEWQADNLTEDEIAASPQILQKGTDWLYSEVNELSFKTHILTYSSHNKLSQGDSQEFLSRFPERDISGIGKNLGAGVFYHWDIADLNGQLHLAIDHSRTVSGGLFVQASIEIRGSISDYGQVVAIGREKIEHALAQIGLEFER